ncbi:hypothetical protein G7Z17_g9290 [Cylindrodendrum hubeiense]|uniref:Nucleolar protein 12 n=1 Tax=Cylindrodendrum hubeiense TaxID=595255 RepID=A0A9P5H872_9HYPO|nr:hypothetical protein G7Z17_g9290 [Cylindrodendrum hubeiense]
MFAKPRPKKSVLPPHNKKRKATYAVEEINFDNEARQEFLTGFHKRKQERIKNAQQEAAKRARMEKIALRKQSREDRRREVEDHVSTVNRLLQESEAAGGVEKDSDESADEWDGFPDQPDLDIVDHEEEYIDEDRYTTVTVESVSVSRDGLYKPEVVEKKDDDEDDKKGTEEADKEDSRPERPKKKKKKFRYETKIERQLTERKRKMKSRS